MMRYAYIERATDVETVRAYLPANYAATQLRSGAIVLYGRDSAGWTLDGYVIPRLASGLRFAREISEVERDALLESEHVETVATEKDAITRALSLLDAKSAPREPICGDDLPIPDGYAGKLPLDGDRW